MNPSTENTTKPAKILVALFRQHSAMQSLQHGENKSPRCHPARERQTVKSGRVLRARPLTDSSCCCICCSCPGRSAPPDTRRRRRTPESPRHATPRAGKIKSNVFKGNKKITCQVKRNNQNCFAAVLYASYNHVAFSALASECRLYTKLFF